MKLMPKKIFKVLVSDHESKVKHLHPQFYSHFPYGVEPVPFFKRHPEYFIVFEKDNGETCMIGARFPRLQLCLAYGVQRSHCYRAGCLEMHLCRDHVGGHCKQGVDCRKDHHFQSDHNKRILRALGLSDHQDDCLLSLLRMSLPQVCRWHNRAPGGCPNKDACTRFHICSLYVQGRCADELCQKKHDFESDHSKRLAKAYELEDKLGKQETLNTLLVHKVKPRTVDRNNLKVTQDLHDLLFPKERDGDTTTPKTLDKIFGIFPSEPFQGRQKLVKEDKSAIWGELLDQNDEIRMLQEALGEDDLLGFLEYQLEVDNQKDTELRLPKVTVDGDDDDGDKKDEPKVDEPQMDDENQAEIDKADEATAPAVDQTPIAAYTGYAPQGDKEYICNYFLKNRCTKDADKCQYAHLTSPYLWQVRVDTVWYNLDTINEDVEKSFKQREKDYITNMPREVPNLAGELMSIVFSKMSAKLLAEERVTDAFKIRQLRVPGPDPRSFGCSKNKLEEMALQELKDIEPNTFRSLYKKRRVHIKTPVAVPTVEPLNFGIFPTENEIETETIQKTETQEIRPDTRFQWQVKINEQWTDLTEANTEIEEAFLDRAPDYATTIPSKTVGQDERFIEISFTDKVATFLDTNDTTPVRRVAKAEEPKAEGPKPETVVQEKTKKDEKEISTEENDEETTQNPADTEESVEVKINDPTDVADRQNNVAVDEPRHIEDNTDVKEKPESGVPVWQWSDDFESWTNHDEEVSRCLEAAFSVGKKSGKMEVDGIKIKINFVEMTQTSEGKSLFLRRHFEDEN